VTPGPAGRPRRDAVRLRATRYSGLRWNPQARTPRAPHVMRSKASKWPSWALGGLATPRPGKWRPLPSISSPACRTVAWLSGARRSARRHTR